MQINELIFIFIHLYVPIHSLPSICTLERSFSNRSPKLYTPVLHWMLRWSNENQMPRQSKQRTLRPFLIKKPWSVVCIWTSLWCWLMTCRSKWNWSSEGVSGGNSQWTRTSDQTPSAANGRGKQETQISRMSTEERKTRMEWEGKDFQQENQNSPAETRSRTQENLWRSCEGHCEDLLTNVFDEIDVSIL